MRPLASLSIGIAIGSGALACGLELAGEATPDAGGGTKIEPVDAAPPVEAAADVASGGSGSDAPADAPIDVASAPEAGGCAAVDAGPSGALALAQFTVAGNAQYDENADGIITLTNSQNNLAGAAWYPTQLPAVSSYALTWTLREGPNDVAGAGFTFAVLETTTVPSSTFVGNNGDAMGLQGIPGNPTGYAVALYLYGGTKLELVAMPSFQVITSQTTTDKLNDGNLYGVDVEWQAPSTLTATLHAPSGPVTVTSSDPRLTTTSPAWIGVTAGTGVASDSHNELAGIRVANVCR